MLKKIEHEFIATSKVIIFKIGIDGAAVLATLIYKYDYWEKLNKITIKENFKGFHISHSDIMEETCFGLSRIRKAIDRLKEEGLIKTIRQGLGKPNLYSVDKEFVNKYIKKHDKEYKNWRTEIRRQNTSVDLVNAMIVENEQSRELKIDNPECSISTTTNNKNTNNKKLKKITNRINAVEENYERLNELTDAISCLMDGSDEEVQSRERVYNLLKSLVPKFMNFTESLEDANLINQIRHFNLDADTIALKIIKNASDINCDVKSNRFGNLFVGLDEMNQNLTKKVS